MDFNKWQISAASDFHFYKRGLSAIWKICSYETFLRVSLICCHKEPVMETLFGVSLVCCFEKYPPQFCSGCHSCFEKYSPTILFRVSFLCWEIFPHNFVQGFILVLRNMPSKLFSGCESSLLAAPGRATPSPYLPCPLLQVSSQQSISF